MVVRKNVMKVLSKQWTQREAQRAIIGAIGISLCLFLLMNCITQGAVISTVFIPNTYDNYMDYFNSLIDSACVNPYAERNVIYPPLCYMLYRVFGSMIPAADYLSGSIYIRSTVTGMFSFGCYLILSLAAFFFFSIQYARKLHVHNRLLSIALMLSAPMLFAIQRGNFIILTVACLMAFLYYKNDPSWIKRHFGFMMLAVAANIKMYPAIFGLLLVSEKRWRDCFFCILYGVTLFVLPMLLFGGLSNIPVLIDNITQTTDKFSTRFGSRTDVGCMFAFLSEKGVFSSLFSALQEKTLLCGTGLLLLCYTCMGTEGQRMLCLTIVCTFIPGFSYMYNLLYLIPLLFIAIQHNRRTVWMLLLAPLLYYPIDISALSLIQVEGAEWLPRLWDIIASLAGVLLISYVVIIAAKRLALKVVSRKRIKFYVSKQKQ